MELNSFFNQNSAQNHIKQLQSSAYIRSYISTYIIYLQYITINGKQWLAQLHIRDTT